MNRRSFLQVMASVGAVTGFRVPLANAANYRGKLFVFVQARGGWDPTSFCDPKTNVAGEPIINNWATAGEVRQAGNIRYAPFAKNQAFFDKYYQRILVVNGVDAQTNSHSAGVTHNWSGRISEGYPTTTALLAAHNGAGLSMPYLSFGGFSNTAGVTVFTRLNNPGEVRNIAKPELNWAGTRRGGRISAPTTGLQSHATATGGWLAWRRLPTSCPETPEIGNCTLRPWTWTRPRGSGRSPI